VNSRLAATAVSRSTVIAVVTGTTVAQMASTLCIAVFPVIAPVLAVEMGVRPALVGYQVSLVYGSAMVAAPLMHSIITRWGACRATQVGLVFCAIAMMFGLTSSLLGLVITSILIGTAMSVMVPASAHLLFRFSPPRNRNVIFSLKQTGVPLAWTLAGITAPVITLAFGCGR
jgi:sugar phosphate permease